MECIIITYCFVEPERNGVRFMDEIEKMQAEFCQSCGMPFDEAHRDYIAKEADGSESRYCTYCYEDGRFLDPDATVEDMIEMGVPYLAEKIGEEAARKMLSQFVPTLERWRK